MKQQRVRVLIATLSTLVLTLPLAANFAARELILPAAGRVVGAGGLEFVTTVWVRNPTAHTVQLRMQFLESGQSNLDAAVVTETFAPGASKTYEDIAGTVFGIRGRVGAIRFLGSDELLVSARIHHGNSLAQSQGVYFAAVPATFAVGAGETTTLQGVTQNDDFHYNVFAVEASGETTVMTIAVFDETGARAGSEDYTLQPYEQRLIGVNDIAPSRLIDGGSIAASVLAGGRAVFAGSLVANGNGNSTGFEMSFRPALLGAGVRSLNGATGALDLRAGNNVTITSHGNSLVLSARGTAGPEGPIGPRGREGVKGEPGEPGTSPKGATGAAGPAGPQGPQGITGDPGPDAADSYCLCRPGPDGPQGRQGVRGRAGARGRQGVAGIEGPQGLKGPQAPAAIAATGTGTIPRATVGTRAEPVVSGRQLLISGEITLETPAGGWSGAVTVTLNGSPIGSTETMTILESGAFVTIPYAFTATTVVAGRQTGVATLSPSGGATAHAGLIAVTVR